MTKSKIERIRQELLAQYGDIALVRLFSKKSKQLVKEYTLANVGINNTADMKEVQKIIREGRPRTYSV